MFLALFINSILIYILIWSLVQEMASTVSVSKGVFSFPRLKKNNVAKFCSSIYWAEGENEDDKEILFSNYKKIRAKIHDITEELQQTIQGQVFVDLMSFIKTKSVTIHAENNCDIPTACLVMGVNMPDHNATFDSLVKLLRNEVTSHIARLQSRNCTTIKAAIFDFVSQLMGSSNLVSPDYLEDEDMTSGVTIKKMQCNMAVLAAWYQTQITNFVSSPRKSNLTGINSSTIVVIVEDIESFSSSVLRDLVLICSNYRHRLPMIFIFGVSTTPLMIHCLLAQEASAVVAMETFQAQMSTVSLNCVIDKIVLNPEIPFHLGGKPFKLLIDIFLYHDLSISNFLKGLKVCMIEHFRGFNVSAILCCNEFFREKRIKKLNEQQLNSFRQIPSLKKLMETETENNRSLFKSNDEMTKKVISKYLKNLEIWFQNFCVLVKVVNAFTCSLPHFPMGKQIREVLSVCLCVSLVESEEWKECVKGLLLNGKEDLQCKIQMSLTILQEAHEDPVLTGLSDHLSSTLNQLKQLSNENIVANDAVKPRMVLQVADRHQFKEKLEQLVRDKSKKLNTYETLRLEFVSSLELFFRKYLCCPSEIALHEVFFFDSSVSIRKQLIGTPRAALTTALSNPQHYLQCQCCQLSNEMNILTTLPDVSIVYKLHLECGRLINLYDWLQAFVAVADPDSDYSDAKKVDQTLQLTGSNYCILSSPSEIALHDVWSMFQ